MRNSQHISGLFFSVLKSCCAFGLVAIILSFMIFSPSGILAYAENAQRYELQKTKLAEKQAEYRALKNRVELLDQDNADPDLVSELLKRKLNVVHPDEKIIPMN